ncbi:hypothetical protein PUN28_010370 [Cardiocondyla obscurior]|uniref:Uncharacterized protein n=1 Tax=Cardiocondyla obscurior TaxID=286306 RepID=A0AAW2FU51_9HYME
MPVSFMVAPRSILGRSGRVMKTTTNALGKSSIFLEASERCFNAQRKIYKVVALVLFTAWKKDKPDDVSDDILRRKRGKLSSVWKRNLGPSSYTSQHPERRSRPRKGILLCRSNPTVIIFRECSPPTEVNKRTAGGRKTRYPRLTERRSRPRKGILLWWSNVLNRRSCFTVTPPLRIEFVSWQYYYACHVGFS